MKSQGLYMVEVQLELKKAVLKSWAKLMLDEKMIDLSRYNAMVLRIDKLKD